MIEINHFLQIASRISQNIRVTVSELATADVPSDVRRRISGHNDEKIYERYPHLSLDTKRRARSRIRDRAEQPHTAIS